MAVYVHGVALAGLVACPCVGTEHAVRGDVGAPIVVDVSIVVVDDAVGGQRIGGVAVESTTRELGVQVTPASVENSHERLTLAGWARAEAARVREARMGRRTINVFASVWW